MNDLTAYKCLVCGHFTISRHDGLICTNCKGPVAPMGKATCIVKTKPIRKPITCQNCNATLVEFDTKENWKIHLKGENVTTDADMITLKCNCGCKLECNIK